MLKQKKYIVCIAACFLLTCGAFNAAFVTLNASQLVEMTTFETQFELVKYETNHTYSGKTRRCHCVFDNFLKIGFI